jgi:hypothetical protein
MRRFSRDLELRSDLKDGAGTYPAPIISCAVKAVPQEEQWSKGISTVIDVEGVEHLLGPSTTLRHRRA